jgi:ATP-dependent helicase HrpA
MNFRVIDTDGATLEEGRDLQSIKESLSVSVGESSELTPQRASDEMVTHEQENTFDQDDVTAAVLDDLIDTVEINLQGILIKGYPALVRQGKQINLRALESKKKSLLETHKALRQLYINSLSEQVKHLKRSIPDIQNLCLKYKDFGSCDDLKRDIINNTIDDIFLFDSINTEEEFNARLDKGKSNLHDKVERWGQLITKILDEYRQIKKLIKNATMAQLDTVTDIQMQLNFLFLDNFITTVDAEWLQQYPRYLVAINKRFEKSKTNATRDRQLRLDFSRLWDEYIKRQETLEKQHIESEQLNHYRWMLEEYRVSLFAQEIKTKFPVSEKRLKKYWDALSDV